MDENEKEKSLGQTLDEVIGILKDRDELTKLIVLKAVCAELRLAIYFNDGP